MSGNGDWRAKLTWVLVALILLAGAGCRGWLAAKNPYPSVDGVHYLEQGRSLLREGRLPLSSFPPGWPLLAAVPMAFVDPAESFAVLRAAQVANVAFGSLLPLLAFLAFRRRLPAPWPVLGALLLAALPLNMIASKGDLSEMSHTCVLLAAWLVCERKPGILGGLLLGYAYLIRPEAALTAAALWMLLIADGRRIPWRFTLGLSIPVVPYLGFLRLTSGHWSLSAKGVFLARSIGERSVGDFLGLVADNVATIALQLPDLIGWPLVLLAVLGGWTKRGRWLLFLLPLLVLPLFDFVMMPRFWLPVLPFILLAAGHGAVRVRELTAGRLPQWAATAGLPVLAVGGFVLAAQEDYPTVLHNSEAYAGLREAGDWLAERVEPDVIVAAYKPYVSFWAACRFQPYPEGETEPTILIEYVRRRGARYLIANVNVVRQHVPGLEPLLTLPLPPHLAAKLTPVHLIRHENAIQSTVVYALNDPLPAPAPGR